MARKPSVSIIGAGRVGGAIGVALGRAGYTITAAWSQSRAGRQRAHRFLDAPILEPADAAAAGEVVFVAVPDDAIAEIATQIAPGVRKGRLVVHTSGGMSVDALDPVREAGGHIGSVHPLQTIPDPQHGADALQGASVAVTCERLDRPAVERLVRAWGGRPFPLADEHKALYHAAAVFASNYVVSSVWAAMSLMQQIGLRNAGALLRPLVHASTENVLARGGAKAITGPVVRGDTEVVRRHIDALHEADRTGGAITEAYRSLAKMTAALSGGDAEAYDEASA